MLEEMRFALTARYGKHRYGQEQAPWCRIIVRERPLEAQFLTGFIRFLRLVVG